MKRLNFVHILIGIFVILVGFGIYSEYEENFQGLFEPPAVIGMKGTFRDAILLDKSNIEHLQANKDRYKEFLQSMDDNLEYKPEPTAKLVVNPSLLPSDYFYTNASSFAKDAKMSYDMALAYVITKDKKYAKTAQRILDGWASGLTRVDSKAEKVIFSINMPLMCMAASWVKYVNRWDDAPFVEFTKRTLQYSTALENTNFSFWGILASTTSAQLIGDSSLERIMYARWQTQMKMLARKENNELYKMSFDIFNDSIESAKLIEYSYLVVEPATIVAKVFAREGLDSYNSEGGMILAASYRDILKDIITLESQPEGKADLQPFNEFSYMYILNKHYEDNLVKSFLHKNKFKNDKYRLNIIYGA